MGLILLHAPQIANECGIDKKLLEVLSANFLRE